MLSGNPNRHYVAGLFVLILVVEATNGMVCLPSRIALHFVHWATKRTLQFARGKLFSPTSTRRLWVKSSTMLELLCSHISITVGVYSQLLIYSADWTKGIGGFNTLHWLLNGGKRFQICVASIESLAPSQYIHHTCAIPFT